MKICGEGGYVNSIFVLVKWGKSFGAVDDGGTLSKFFFAHNNTININNVSMMNNTRHITLFIFFCFRNTYHLRPLSFKLFFTHALRSRVFLTNIIIVIVVVVVV